MAHLELPTTALVGYEDIDVSANGVKSLNVPIDPNTTYPCTQAFVQVQKASVRLRVDGANPTTTSGILISINESVHIEGAAALNGARFLADTNQAVRLSVTYFA